MLRGARWVIVAACLADVRFGRFVRTSGTVLCPVVGRRDPGWIVAVFLLFLLRVLHVLQVPGRGVLVRGVVGNAQHGLSPVVGFGRCPYDRNGIPGGSEV